MLTNTERQQIVEEVNAGTYGIDEALDDIAAAQKGEEVRKALYAEALVLNREGHAGSTDMIARQQIANLQTSVNGQISTLRTEVGDDIDDLETALNSGLATQNGKIAAQNATIANVVANYNVEYGSTELWASTGETGALAAGTTVTLSEDVSHFDYIDIYSFCGNSNVLDTVPVDAKLQSSAGYALRWVNLSDPGSSSYKAYVRIIETRLHIIGTTLTIDHQVTYRNGEEVNISGAEITQSNRSTYVGELGIMKVVGRKITANTEIEDVRIGADGTEYNSAGQAVRGQFTEVKAQIPAIDASLATAGKAADAKATGDALTAANGRLEDLESITDAQQFYPINLLNFNDPDFATGKLSASTGLVATGSTSRTTGFIPVEEGKTYNWIYGADITISQVMSRICAYDSSKNYLSSYTQDSVRGFTVPADSGIAYVRFSGSGTYLVSTVQNNMFTEGFPSAYSEYFEPYTIATIKNSALDMDASPTPDSAKPVQSGGVYTALQSKQNMLTFDNEPTSGSNNPVKSGGMYNALAPVSEAISTELVTSANLLNLNDPDVVPNKSISTSTGLPSGTANGFTVTGFIPVTAGETYAIYYLDSFTQGISLRRVCYYDAGKAYIANGYADYVRSFTPPTGCSFVRIVADTANISTEKHAILCVAGSVSEYVPYFDPYNKYAVKNTALDGDYIRTLGGTEQVFSEWELGSYNNSWNFTDSTTVIMSDYIPVGDHLNITVAEGYTAKVYPFYVTGKRGATNPTTVTGEYVINSAETARYVRITLAKTTAETITDPNTYGLNVAIIRYGNQSTFNTHISATPNAQDVVPSEVLPQYLALVAVKEKNVLGKVPVTVGYLYRTVTTPYKLYYAQGKPDNIKYLCDWDSSIAGATHNAPIWYSFGITDEGDIICVHRGEIEASSSERVRDNPIVYPHTDYAHPVLVELTGTKPTSWISNCGDYAESGHFFFGEYIRDGHTEANVWDVSAPYTQAANWTVIKTYERDANPSDPSTMVLGKIEHIHHVSRDPFSGILYVTTGDHHTEARIDYLKNGTWGILAEGDEEICRQLNFVYTPTYIYWASDAFSIYDPDKQTMVGGAHKFFRAKRDANGLIDLDNLERYSIPYLSGSIATYHVAYIKDPECILILDRQDASSNFTELPFHVWDIKGERLEYSGQCKTARGSVAQFLGFRCECCQHYPNLYDSVISVGFSLYPNSIDVCGNPNPAIITSQGGVTSTDATNKNQVNSMTVKVVKT